MVVSGHRNQSSGPGLCWGGWEREDSQNASALSAGERRLAARWAALADPPRRLFARLFRRAAAASGGVTREAAAAYPEIDVPAAAAALVGSGLAARPGWRGAAAVVPALRLAELRDAARRAAPDGPALAALGRAALVDRLLAALPPPSPGGGITVQPLPPPPPVAPPVTPDRGGGGGGGTGHDHLNAPIGGDTTAVPAASRATDVVTLMARPQLHAVDRGVFASDSTSAGRGVWRDGSRLKGSVYAKNWTFRGSSYDLTVFGGGEFRYKAGVPVAKFHYASNRAVKAKGKVTFKSSPAARPPPLRGAFSCTGKHHHQEFRLCNSGCQALLFGANPLSFGFCSLGCSDEFAAKIKIASTLC
ncbi:hypothetical protein I4F81_011154 [Pyropia yezoensis]|uniref:Uncharacterized protein n=1 Tax=Pyropia yezoensis TaxID=2788 RepID=A0ACC3CFE8_PYRYE|nr:hypothetical protein I4F81_011154 [Neopyropia yezoensis]